MSPVTTGRIDGTSRLKFGVAGEINPLERSKQGTPQIVNPAKRTYETYICTSSGNSARSSSRRFLMYENRSPPDMYSITSTCSLRTNQTERCAQIKRKGRGRRSCTAVDCDKLPLVVAEGIERWLAPPHRAHQKGKQKQKQQCIPATASTPHKLYELYELHC